MLSADPDKNSFYDPVADLVDITMQRTTHFYCVLDHFFVERRQCARHTGADRAAARIYFEAKSFLQLQ